LPQGADHAAHLVPEDGRRVDPTIHVPVQDVQVGVADARRARMLWMQRSADSLGFPDRPSAAPTLDPGAEKNRVIG
jgi:hypothetical protein